MVQRTEEGLWRDSWTDEAVRGQQVVQLPDCHMVMTMKVAPSSLELTQNAMAIKNHIIKEIKDKLNLKTELT
jgi:hypothetical protein